MPSVSFAPQPTPVEEMSRLRAVLGGGPRLLVKRDDAIGFAFGGNKVRKMRLVAGDALARQADTLITCGGAFNPSLGSYEDNVVVFARRLA